MTSGLSLRRRKVCGASAVVLVRTWRNVEYVSLDFETTGLDLRRDSILSYGAVTVHNGRIRGGSAVYALARPECQVSPASTVVHALRGVDCADAPSERETAQSLRTLLDGKVLVAHAAWIETSFLKRYLAMDGCRPGPLVVDTAALARAAGLAASGGSSEPSLEWLAAKMGLPVHTPHHALGDAMTTATLFLALVTTLSRAAPDFTAGELIKLSRQYSRR